MFNLLRRLVVGLKNIPSLVQGYNIYVKPEKCNLLRSVFKDFFPKAKSFADLGGVWNVNAGYTRYVLKNFPSLQGTLVDREFTIAAQKSLKYFANVKVVEGNFTENQIIDKIGKVDVIILYDVLLHQVKPDWDEVIKKYAPVCSCFVIYNQQICSKPTTVRLTELPLDECNHLAPRTDGLYDYIYAHAEEINPKYNRKWKDIIDPWQWGITDNDLRRVLIDLGFKEVFYRNYGKYADLQHFENHGFVFIKA